MVDALDSVYLPGVAAGTSEIVGISQWLELAATRHDDIFSLAGVDPAFFQFFQPAGILRAAGIARSGIAAGRMAGERIGFSAWQC